MRFIPLFIIRLIIFFSFCKIRFKRTFCIYEHASASMTQIVNYSAIVKGIKVCIQIFPDFKNTGKNQDIAGFSLKVVVEQEHLVAQGGYFMSILVLQSS